MAMDELTRRRVETALAPVVERVPEAVRHQVKIELEVRGNNATVFECRPHVRDPTGIFWG